MALLMSCIMSFFISVFNIGAVEGIWVIWIKAWILGFIVAFPTVLMVSPIVKKLVEVLVDTDDQ